MKFTLVLMTGILVQAFTLSMALASETNTTCKVVTTDVGTIIGRGANKNSAFEDAAEKCFDRRAQLYQMKKGSSVDEEAGLVMIDMCANISCS